MATFDVSVDTQLLDERARQERKLLHILHVFGFRDVVDAERWIIENGQGRVFPLKSIPSTSPSRELESLRRQLERVTAEAATLRQALDARPPSEDVVDWKKRHDDLADKFDDAVKDNQSLHLVCTKLKAQLEQEGRAAKAQRKEWERFKLRARTAINSPAGSPSLLPSLLPSAVPHSAVRETPTRVSPTRRSASKIPLELDADFVPQSPSPSPHRAPGESHSHPSSRSSPEAKSAPASPSKKRNSSPHNPSPPNVPPPAPRLVEKTRVDRLLTENRPSPRRDPTTSNVDRTPRVSHLVAGSRPSSATSASGARKWVRESERKKGGRKRDVFAREDDDDHQVEASSSRRKVGVEGGGSSRKRKSVLSPTSSVDKRRRKTDEEEGGGEGDPDGKEMMRLIHEKRRTEVSNAPPGAFKGRGRYFAGLPREGEETINSRFVVDPKQNFGVGHIFDEVARGKGERRQMHGVDCHCCQAYYQKAGVEGADAVSRHRHHNPPANTPPGYWDLAFPNSQRLTEINAKAVEKQKRKFQDAEDSARSGNGPYRYRGQ